MINFAGISYSAEVKGHSVRDTSETPSQLNLSSAVAPPLSPRRLLIGPAVISRDSQGLWEDGQPR